MKTKEQILDTITELITKSEDGKSTIESDIVRRSKSNLVTMLSISHKIEITDLTKIINAEKDKDPILRDPALDIICDNIDYDIIFYSDKTELIIIRTKNEVQEFGEISQLQLTESLITVSSPIVNISDFAMLNGLSEACVLNDALNLKYIDIDVYLDNFKLPLTAFPSSTPYSFIVDCEPYKGFTIKIDDDIQTYTDIVSFEVDVYDDRVLFNPLIWIDHNNNSNDNGTVILSIKDGIEFLRDILTSPYMKIKKGNVLMTVETGINYDFFRQE